MKILFLPILLFSVSCATYAPKSYKQNCAQKGMVLAGVTESSSSTSFYNFNSNSTTYSDSSGEAVTCVVPKNEIEKCEIEVENKVASPIIEYNKSIGTKRLINGAAYGLYIIPGIASKLYYDKMREKALQESDEIRNSLDGYCSGSLREPANFRDSNSHSLLKRVDRFLDEK